MLIACKWPDFGGALEAAWRQDWLLAARVAARLATSLSSFTSLTGNVGALLIQQSLGDGIVVKHNCAATKWVYHSEYHVFRAL